MPKEKKTRSSKIHLTESKKAFLIGGLLGAVIFIFIYGAAIIVPTYTDWVFSRTGDMIQHQLGWEFFRKSPWSFPIGLTEGLIPNSAVSCMYTDSIPLFAVFFKLLSPILPESFQYFGLWGIFCYILNGGFSAVLLHKIKPSLAFSSVGSIFYTLFPPSVFRLFMHDSLIAIWLILVPLIMCAYSSREWKKPYTPVVIWTLTGVSAILIHVYFIPMIYAVMLGYIIIEVFRDKKYLRAAAVFVSTTVFSVLTMWIIGAFHGSGKYNDNGLGIFSANMNAFFNPFDYSKFLKPLNSFGGQYEGFGYIGLGIIVCGVVAAIALFSVSEKRKCGLPKLVIGFVKSRKIELIAVSAIFLVSFIAALSPKVTLNGRVLYEITLPTKLNDIASVFRSSGRFIWLPSLIIVTFCLGAVSKLSRQTAVFAVSLCLAVQMLDMRDWLLSLHNALKDRIVYTPTLVSEKWDELSENTDELVFLPLPDDFHSYWQMYYDFALLARDKDMKMSSFYLARSDEDALKAYAQQQYEALKSNNGRTDALYIFFDKKDVPKNAEGLEVYDIDGYTVGKVTK